MLSAILSLRRKNPTLDSCLAALSGTSEMAEGGGYKNSGSSKSDTKSLKNKLLSPRGVAQR
jgi:hypothetical protein